MKTKKKTRNAPLEFGLGDIEEQSENSPSPPLPSLTNSRPKF